MNKKQHYIAPEVEMVELGQMSSIMSTSAQGSVVEDVTVKSGSWVIDDGE